MSQGCSSIAVVPRGLPSVVGGAYSAAFDFRLSSFVFRLSSFVFRLSSFVFRLSSFVFRLSSSVFATNINSWHPIGCIVPAARQRCFALSRESLSLWMGGKEKVTKEKSTPHRRLSGIHALKVRARWPLVGGLTSLCIRRLAASMRPPSGLSAITDHRRSGAPTSKEARSLRAEATAPTSATTLSDCI